MTAADPTPEMPEVIPVLIKGAQGVVKKGHIRRMVWSRRRAISLWVAVCVTIYSVGFMAWANPVTHLFAPPVWLLVGPYAGYRLYRLFVGQVSFKRGEGTCPYCERSISIYPHQSRFPFTATCPVCRQEFEGFPQNSAAAP